MKKILSTIIAAIMLLCSISVLSGCKNKDNSNNNNNNSKAEVVLDKVSAAAYKETSVKPQKMAAFNLSGKSTDNSENESADNSESESESPDISVDIPADYTFIFKSQTTINFDIKLNNPKNYYIMDFKLTCDEEQIEYYDKEMEKWTPINNIWIRWSGSNNQESRYRLRLPNPEISPDKIKISEMYYSDRTDGTNKTAVNMNNKETYTVYKVEDDLVTTETVYNSREKYVFRMAKKEGVEILSVKGNSVDLAKEGDNYIMPESGKIVIEYQKVNGNVTYKGKCEKEIELIRFEIDDRRSGGINNEDIAIIDIIFKNLSGIDCNNIILKNGDDIYLAIFYPDNYLLFTFENVPKELYKAWMSGEKSEVFKKYELVIANYSYNLYDITYDLT